MWEGVRPHRGAGAAPQQEFLAREALAFEMVPKPFHLFRRHIQWSNKNIWIFSPDHGILIESEELVQFFIRVEF